jgi:hypothetical protein
MPAILESAGARFDREEFIANEFCKGITHRASARAVKRFLASGEGQGLESQTIRPGLQVASVGRRGSRNGLRPGSGCRRHGQGLHDRLILLSTGRFTAGPVHGPAVWGRRDAMPR